MSGSGRFAPRARSLVDRRSRKPTMLCRVRRPPFLRALTRRWSFPSPVVGDHPKPVPIDKVPSVAFIAPLARLRPFRGAPFQQDRCRQHDARWCARRRTNSGGTCKSSLRRASASSARSTARPPKTGCRNRLRAISFGGCHDRAILTVAAIYPGGRRMTSSSGFCAFARIGSCRSGRPDGRSMIRSRSACSDETRPKANSRFPFPVDTLDALFPRLFPET